MFRLSGGLPQIDAAEEKRRVREGVKTNVFSFIVLCAAIRIGKQLYSIACCDIFWGYEHDTTQCHKCDSVAWEMWIAECSFHNNAHLPLNDAFYFPCSSIRHLKGIERKPLRLWANQWTNDCIVYISYGSTKRLHIVIDEWINV